MLINIFFFISKTVRKILCLELRHIRRRSSQQSVYSVGTTRDKKQPTQLLTSQYFTFPTTVNKRQYNYRYRLYLWSAYCKGLAVKDCSTLFWQLKKQSGHTKIQYPGVYISICKLYLPHPPPSGSSCHGTLCFGSYHALIAWVLPYYFAFILPFYFTFSLFSLSSSFSYIFSLFPLPCFISFPPNDISWYSPPPRGEAGGGEEQSWALEAMKRCDEALNASSLHFFCQH